MFIAAGMRILPSAGIRKYAATIGACKRMVFKKAIHRGRRVYLKKTATKYQIAVKPKQRNAVAWNGSIKSKEIPIS